MSRVTLISPEQKENNVYVSAMHGTWLQVAHHWSTAGQVCFSLFCSFHPYRFCRWTEQSGFIEVRGPMIGTKDTQQDFDAACKYWHKPLYTDGKCTQLHCPYKYTSYTLCIHIVHMLLSFTWLCLAWGDANLTDICYICEEIDANLQTRKGPDNEGRVSNLCTCTDWQWSIMSCDTEVVFF